jgi:uncharacterized membrane protein YidH (DUF202 family)
VTSDSEMETWRDAWKAPEGTSGQPRILDMRREVRRKECRLRALHLLEFASALVLLAFSYLVAQRYPSTEMVLWAVVIWILTLLAAGYSLWNWRSLWTAERRSAREYAQTYEKYCVAGLRHIRFGVCLLAMNLILAIPWISWKFFRSARTGHFGIVAYLISIGLIAGLTAGFLFWFSKSRRNRLRELEELRQYRKSLEEEV